MMKYQRRHDQLEVALDDISRVIVDDVVFVIALKVVFDKL